MATLRSALHGQTGPTVRDAAGLVAVAAAAGLVAAWRMTRGLPPLPPTLTNIAADPTRLPVADRSLPQAEPLESVAAGKIEKSLRLNFYFSAWCSKEMSVFIARMEPEIDKDHLPERIRGS